MGKGVPVGKVEEPAVWPRFLRGANAREILARIGDSDPLRLRERSARRLRELWVLLDPDRAFHRALAVIAEAAPDEDPPADLEAWTSAKIDLAIDQLVSADRRAEQTHPELVTEEEMDFPLLTQSMSLDPQLIRSVSVAFNSLGELPRRAFFELVIEARELGECIEGGPWNEDGLYEAIQTAMNAFGLACEPGPKARKRGTRP